MRINGGPRAQPALAFIVEAERSGYEGPKESPGRTVVSAKTTRNERRIESERRKERMKVYTVRDGDVPRVAATDFAGDNNVDEREENRKAVGINFEYDIAVSFFSLSFSFSFLSAFSFLCYVSETPSRR